MLGAGSTKPIMSECLLQPAGKNEGTKRPLNSKSLEGFLVLVRTPVTEIRCGLANDFRCNALSGEGTGQNCLSRLVVSFNMGGGKRKLGSNPFKAMPERVGIEFARFCGVVAYTQKIVDGVLIFFTAQPIMGYGWTGSHAGRFALADLLIELSDKGGDFFFARTRLFFGWHFSGIDPFDHLCP